MHISDGILTDTIAGQVGLVTTTAASLGMLAYSLKKVAPEDIARTSLLTAVFFVTSLIHFKFGFTSLHLVLVGLLGIVLGWRSVTALFVGLTLQALFFGHGGVTVLGVNLFNFSLGALLAYYLFRSISGRSGKRLAIAGAISGFLAVMVAAVCLAIELLLIGETFTIIAELVLLANLPLALIEALLTASVLTFLHKVRPAMLK
jgi:cobalt/nickel transport system permease protein